MMSGLCWPPRYGSFMMMTSPSLISDAGKSASMALTAGGMLPRWTGSASPWAMVWPLTSNRATEQSAPSLMMPE